MSRGFRDCCELTDCKGVQSEYCTYKAKESCDYLILLLPLPLGYIQEDLRTAASMVKTYIQASVVLVLHTLVNDSISRPGGQPGPMVVSNDQETGLGILISSQGTDFAVGTRGSFNVKHFFYSLLKNACWQPNVWCTSLYLGANELQTSTGLYGTTSCFSITLKGHHHSGGA